MYNRDEMFSFCETAHKHKDKIMGMMMESEENGIEIPMEMKIDYLINRAICKDNMREVTRTEVYQPVNAKMREADGISLVADMSWREMLEHLRAKFATASATDKHEMRLTMHKFMD